MAPLSPRSGGEHQYCTSTSTRSRTQPHHRRSHPSGTPTTQSAGADYQTHLASEKYWRRCVLDASWTQTRGASTSSGRVSCHQVPKPGSKHKEHVIFQFMPIVTIRWYRNGLDFCQSQYLQVVIKLLVGVNHLTVSQAVNPSQRCSMCQRWGDVGSSAASAAFGSVDVKSAPPISQPHS